MLLDHKSVREARSGREISAIKTAIGSRSGQLMWDKETVVGVLKNVVIDLTMT